MAPHDKQLQLGDTVTVQSFRADGVCSRWWQAMVEQVTTTCIVTMTPAATPVEGPRGGWVQQYYIRAFYWFARPYNLLEVYCPNGSVEEVYIHIASPAQLDQATIHYIDHELDVVMRPGEMPHVVDEDEFAQAAITYNYSVEFQAACRKAVADAVQLATQWKVRGLTRPA